MTTKTLLTAATLIALTTALLSFDLPAGWFKAGTAPENYDMGIKKGAGQNGKNAATIKSISSTAGEFGTLIQNCIPDHYLGKRVRMSGYVKTKDVADWAGLWLRIDQKASSQALGFDNMHDGKQDRSVKGTTGWTKYDIVLNVPAQASGLAYGALLAGTGQIWFDNITFEIVPDSVPTTGKENEAETPLPEEPENLDFEN